MTTTFNTSTLIGAAEDITVIIDSNSWDANYTRNRRSGDTSWTLAAEKDAPLEYHWTIPDQDVTFADTGYVAVKTDKDEVIFLSFTQPVAMTAEDFIRRMDSAEGEQDSAV